MEIPRLNEMCCQHVYGSILVLQEVNLTRGAQCFIFGVRFHEQFQFCFSNVECEKHKNASNFFELNFNLRGWPNFNEKSCAEFMNEQT